MVGWLFISMGFYIEILFDLKAALYVEKTAVMNTSVGKKPLENNIPLLKKNHGRLNFRQWYYCVYVRLLKYPEVNHRISRHRVGNKTTCIVSMHTYDCSTVCCSRIPFIIHI